MAKFQDVFDVCREMDFMGSRYGDAAAAPPDLDDLSRKTTEITGGVFRTMITAGYQHLAENKDELNRINVFPIPDADTGNNMKLALRPGVLNQLFEPADSLSEAASRFAEDTLMAGQGNSGTVLSHFFISLSRELAAAGRKDKVSVSDFAEALEKAGATINAAFPPETVKEGTIVSVVRKSTQLAAGGFTALGDMVEVWEKQAKIALYETPDELEVDGRFVLKEARAKDPSIDADSGAKGFYYVVKGILHALDKPVTLEGVCGPGTQRRITEAAFATAAEVFDGTEKHQYCTECVIPLCEGASKLAIEKRLGDPKFGDSMVVVSAPSADGKSELAKVHIHSDEPQAVFDVLIDEFSKSEIPIKEKVDDMRRQVADSKRGYNPDKFKVTLVIDSTCQVGKWAANSYAHVPVVATIHGEPYSCSIDPPTVNVLEVLNRSRHVELKAGTAAPPIQAFKNAFDAALKIPDKDVICICLNKYMSKTHGNAVAARDQLSEDDKKRVHVLDHGYMLGPSVPIMASMLHAASKGCSTEQLLTLFEEIRARGYFAVFFNGDSMMRLVKHGRVPKELGDAVKADPSLVLTVGTSPAGREEGKVWPPMEYPACAGTLKNTLKPPVPGHETAYRAAITALRDSLKPGEVVRDFTFAEFARSDRSNKILEIAQEILGDRLVEPTHMWEPFLAIAAVAAWGGAFLTYWVDDGETSRPE
mmetsp:Transcript_28476/g.74836  ORF Transcript_28476/g.74836 Transcript_28476/m.74836 type:complete len:704 (-) Transcript_28476:85-2196(-)